MARPPRRDAPTRTAAFAYQLCEVLLLTERGVDTHLVSVDMGVVVGYMGEVSAATGTWDGVFKHAVVCCTGVGASLDAAQLDAAQPVKVRDLWARADLGSFSGSFTAAALRSHASMLVKVSQA